MKLLPITLKKNEDGSVTGTLPDGKECRWDKFSSTKPTKRNKKIMLNCYYWEPIWIE